MSLDMYVRSRVAKKYIDAFFGAPNTQEEPAAVLSAQGRTVRARGRTVRARGRMVRGLVRGAVVLSAQGGLSVAWGRTVRGLVRG
jgi:hypothetical protein